MKRVLCLALALCAVVGCGPAPTPTPDLVATQVAVMQAAAATLTAGAPTATASTVPSPTPTLPAPPTLAPTAAPTGTVMPTVPPPPRTATAPPVGPALGKFAVVDVYSDDVLNVRTGPGVSHAIAGTIPYHGRDVEVRAGGQEVAGSWWVPVQHDDVEGWVNSRHLAQQEGWAGDSIAASAAQAILALRDGDWQAVSSLVHPDKGVRFSPYTFVQTAAGTDLVFSATQVASLWVDPTVYHWGTFDGSGEPIDLTFAKYYERFIYDVDFARPDVVGFGVTVGAGNTLNNIAQAYPQAVAVEYHFQGFDPQYAGLDWRSLRLVFEEKAGAWYLVGIVHDEWTI